ncbi:zinc metalloproteinase nas-4-like, partial [Ciona intestinalis]
YLPPVLKCKFDISTCTLPCPFGYNSKSDDDICPVSCTCASKGNFEGDVHFVGEDVPHLLETYGYIDKDDEEFSLFVGSYLKYAGQISWTVKALPSGRIPVGYKLDTFLSTHARAKKSIDDAAKMFRESTCIDIEPHDPAKHGEHFVNIKNEAGCSSSVGYVPPSREQHMSLVVSCHHVGTVAHEFLHTLGFKHEQSRPDRDSFVKIHFENMSPNRVHNFKKLKLAAVFDLKSEYDLGSIMHYGGYAFTNNQEPTITSVADGYAVREREKMSDKDLSELNIRSIPIKFDHYTILDLTVKFVTNFSCLFSFYQSKNVFYTAAPMFMRQSTSVAHLCSGATSDVVFIFGDFNGDRNVDVMCGSQDGDFEIGLATSNGDINTATWRGRLDGCVVQSGQIAVGDFNGDSMSDIVCVDHIKKRTTVRLSNNGQFPTGEGYSGSFCTDDSDWLIPLDIDGDNKWDLMCSHSNRENELLISRFSS